jgi:hypothetical protein
MGDIRAHMIEADDFARRLALSKMNWNNDAPYDPLPVTMGFAQVLALVVRRMSGLGRLQQLAEDVARELRTKYELNTCARDSEAI